MKFHIIQPERLNEISLKQYQLFIKASELLEGHFLSQKMVSIFCSIPLAETLMISKKDIDSTVSEINALFEQEQELQQRFKISGVEFGFIPSLEDITFGEFVDLDTYLGDWETMNKAMAVLYRPITSTVGDKYEIEEYSGTERYKDLMEHAPIDVVMGAMVFFYHLSNELTKATQASLVEELVRESTQEQRSLVQSGVGTLARTLSQEETLRELMLLLPTNLHNASII